MRNSCVSYLEQTAKLYPDKIALDDSVKSYTFAELQHKAKMLSFAISELLGDVHNSPIAVYLPKSADCIVAFSAILYTGNCYVPLDTKMPEARLIKIIKNLQPVLVLTDKRCCDVLEQILAEKHHILCMDDIEMNNIAEPTGYLHTIDTDPAYIMYTSGSTGVPKGVVISHRSVIDYIDWAVEFYNIQHEETFGNQAPFFFDNSILDTYLCFSVGIQLCIIPESLFVFPLRLLHYLKEKKITSIFWVPSALISIANADALDNVKGLSLRRIMFAGEVMPNKQLNYWRKHFPQAFFANLYGPTEITDVCTTFIVQRTFEDSEPLPIGKPCRNTDAFLLNSQNEKISEPGCIGELCIRGSSLAFGYWHNPEKTAAAFTQNPLNVNYPEKIYRTGDLVMWNEQGELMYCGRKDSQIKHMGYRIELGEIEVAAGSLPQMQKVCALYDHADKQIVLYYEAVEEIAIRDIRIELLNLLPKYMIPTVYHWMKEMPLNMNGKIDRNRLKQEMAGEKK